MPEQHTEYPKWVYPEGDVSRAVLVQDEEQERAATKAKRQRKAAAEAPVEEQE